MNRRTKIKSFAVTSLFINAFLAYAYPATNYFIKPDAWSVPTNASVSASSDGTYQTLSSTGGKLEFYVGTELATTPLSNLDYITYNTRQSDGSSESQNAYLSIYTIKGTGTGDSQKWYETRFNLTPKTLGDGTWHVISTDSINGEPANILFDSSPNRGENGAAGFQGGDGTVGATLKEIGSDNAIAITRPSENPYTRNYSSEQLFGIAINVNDTLNNMSNGGLDINTFEIGASGKVYKYNFVGDNYVMNVDKTEKIAGNYDIGLNIAKGESAADKSLIMVESDGTSTINGGMATGTNSANTVGNIKNEINADTKKGVVTISNASLAGNEITSEDFGPRLALIRAEENSEVIVKDSNFQDNKAESLNAGNGTYGTVISSNGAKISVDNATMKNNESVSNARNVQGAAIYAVGSEVDVKNSTFDGNKATAVKNAGGAAMSVWGSKTTIENSEFKNNKSVAGSYAQGTVYAEGADWGGTNPSQITIKDSTFDNNSAEGNDYAVGGALSAVSTNNIASGEVQNNRLTANITDTVFTNNVVSAPTANFVVGGAIYSQSAEVNINATKDMTYSGNKVLVNGVANDNNGGFLYMDSYYGTATTNFNVASEKTLTIGDGTKGEDSIASDYATSIINKTGAGTLTVNGSMSNYQGQLNVTEGTMNVNNGLGATVVVNNAELNLIKGNYEGLSSEKVATGSTTAIINAANSSKLSIKDSSFVNNSVNTNETVNGTYGVAVGVSNSNAEIDNVVFRNNVGTAVNNTQGIVYFTCSESSTVKNSTFESNTLNGNGDMGAGAGIASFGSSLNIENVKFLSNQVTSTGQADGSALYVAGNSWGGSSNAVVNVVNSTFDGNVSNSDSVSRGALFVGDGNANTVTVNVTDSTFTNNIAKGNGYVAGGAISTQDQNININITKDASYTGNKAIVNGVADDSRGGFMFINSKQESTENNKFNIVGFNIAESATLSIGNGNDGEDSIASRDAKATINKIGAGTLTVNGSMDYYTGALNVSEGVMNVNNKISASTINVAEGADFNVAISKGNAGSYILNATEINGFSDSNKLNVGFDVRNNGADLLGTTTSIFKEGSATTAYDIAGEGSTYAVGNMFLTYTDNDGVVTIGNTLSIGNSALGGTQAVIAKDSESGATTLTTTNNQTEVVIENTKQAVTQVVASESDLVLGQNSEVKTQTIAADSKVVLNNDTAKVEVTSSISDSAQIEITAGQLAVNGVTSTSEGERNTTIASQNADIIASGGSIILSDTSKSFEMSGDIIVDAGQNLEIQGSLAVSGEKLITSSTGSSVKLQSNITLSDVNSKLTLSGDTSGRTSFTGVSTGSQRSSIVVSGMLSVGNSPAVVTYKNVNVNFGENTGSSNVLKMEVFGTGNVAGTDFDQIILDDAALDFGVGAASTGKIEVVVDSQAGTSFTAGEHTIQLFDITNGSSITGLENNDVTIVLAATLKNSWEVVFTSTGTTELTDETALATLMSDGTVSLMFTQIPEPATLAAIIGAIALAMAIYRRRK